MGHASNFRFQGLGLPEQISANSGIGCYISCKIRRYTNNPNPTPKTTQNQTQLATSILDFPYDLLQRAA